MFYRRALILVALLCFSFAMSPALSLAEERPAGQAKAKRSGGKRHRGKRKGRGKRRRGNRVKYKVIPGDTLRGIAKRYGVKVADLRRWNTLRGNNIVAGKTLTIYAKTRPRVRNRTTHKVKKGETLGSIAKKHKVSIHDLISWNNRLDPRKLKVGSRLTIYKFGRIGGGGSGSVGRANAGHLVGGEQLPDGRGYYVRSRHNAWGTPQTISLLRKVIGKTKKKFKRAENLVIGDISHQNGGSFRPHKSHQSGRDADISYYAKKSEKKPRRFKRMTPQTLDPVKNWYLFDQFIKTGQVQYIFVNYNLQKVLYEQARKKGVSKKRLKKIIQYPHGRGAQGIIRYSHGHDDHFHIRFKCAQGDKSCR